ncbi:MAG TPA: hypothetical protein PLZ01_02315, partial [bacterium]|nr:hypothetical protein [bacterium]
PPEQIVPDLVPSFPFKEQKIGLALFLRLALFRFPENGVWNDHTITKNQKDGSQCQRHETVSRTLRQKEIAGNQNQNPQPKQLVVAGGQV